MALKKLSIKSFIGVCIFLSGVLFGFSSVSAATISQLSTSTASQTPNDSNHQFFVQSMDLSSMGDNGTTTVKLWASSCPAANPNPAFHATTTAAGYSMSNSYASYSCSNGEMTWTLGTAWHDTFPAFNPALPQNYIVIPYRDNIYSRNMRGCSGSCYAGGSAFWANSSGVYYAADSNIGDLAFSVSGPDADPVNYISYNLVDGNYYQNFSYINMEYNFASTTSQGNYGGNIFVQFATSSDFAVIGAAALNTTVYNYNASTTLSIPLNNTLYYGTTTQWYSRAFLYDVDWNVLATSSISFYVSEEYSPAPYVNANTQTVEDVLIGKFPFVYFYQVADILTGLPEYSTTTLSVSFNFPTSSVWGYAGTSTVTLFSETKIKDMLGSDNVQNFHDFIELLLWAVFGLDIYFLIRKIFNR